MFLPYNCMRHMNTFLSQGKKNYNYFELISNSNTTIHKPTLWNLKQVMQQKVPSLLHTIWQSQKKVMHRAAKSKNILIDIISNKSLALGRSSLHVKVTDFGLSKLQDRSTTHCMWVQLHGWLLRCLGWTTWHTQTQLMCIVLAMVFFEVLTGEIPFAEVQRTDIYQNIKIGMRPIYLPRLISHRTCQHS
jgi:hypothetical protein